MHYQLSLYFIEEGQVIADESYYASMEAVDQRLLQCINHPNFNHFSLGIA